MPLRCLFTRLPPAPPHREQNGHATNGSSGISEADAPAAKRARHVGPVSGAPPPSGRRPPVAIVLDIEGTVAPIAFVKGDMFAFAAQRAEGHLRATLGSDETRDDIEAIRAQAGPRGGVWSVLDVKGKRRPRGRNLL